MIEFQVLIVDRVGEHRSGEMAYLSVRRADHPHPRHPGASRQILLVDAPVPEVWAESAECVIGFAMHSVAGADQHWNLHHSLLRLLHAMSQGESRILAGGIIARGSPHDMRAPQHPLA